MAGLNGLKLNLSGAALLSAMKQLTQPSPTALARKRQKEFEYRASDDNQFKLPGKQKTLYQLNCSSGWRKGVMVTCIATGKSKMMVHCEAIRIIQEYSKVRVWLWDPDTKQVFDDPFNEDHPTFVLMEQAESDQTEAVVV